MAEGVAAAPAAFLNFAYGSNMLTQRLQARSPSARPVTVAVLRGHELRWHKLSQDGSGKCDIVRSARPSAQVIGVVHEILLVDKPALDAAEGLGHGYDERQVIVESRSGPLQAWAYVATAIDPAAVPYTWYKALVLAGARQHRFPAPYLRRLESVPARDDADVARAELHFRLAAGG